METAEIKSNTTPQVEWNLPEGVKKFSEEHVYFAYRIGHHEGAEKEKREFDASVNNNSIIAASDTFKVIQIMNNAGIKPVSAHLKIVSRNSMKVMITVSDIDFAKEAFETVYLQVFEVQEASKTDSYSIAFTFINRSDSFNDELVKLDGFVSSFRPLEIK